VQKRAGRTSQTITLPRRNSASFSVRANLAQQCTELSVSGWDVSAKDFNSETSDSSSVGAELEDDTAAAIFYLKSLENGGFGLHTVPLNAEEARSEAEARYLERARRFVTGIGNCDGVPAFRAGSRLQLGGLGSYSMANTMWVRVTAYLPLSEGFYHDLRLETSGIDR